MLCRNFPSVCHRLQSILRVDQAPSTASLLLIGGWQRAFSASSACRRAAAFVSPSSHYDVLGITRNATQADVKSAYYRLSMIHHPDKSDGSAESVEKFRSITAAYEVLSNYRLRRLYDKGIGGTLSSIRSTAYGHSAPDPTVADDPEPDDPQTQFYKRHMTRTETPRSGRTPIYDFDAWSAAHYGKAFERRKESKMRYEMRQRTRVAERSGFETEIVVFGLSLGFLLMMIASYSIATPDTDMVKPKRSQ